VSYLISEIRKLIYDVYHQNVAEKVLAILIYKILLKKDK